MRNRYNSNSNQIVEFLYGKFLKSERETANLILINNENLRCNLGVSCGEMNAFRVHGGQNNHRKTSCVRKPLPLITRSSASFSGIFHHRISILPFRHHFPFLLVLRNLSRCGHLINLHVNVFYSKYLT